MKHGTHKLAMPQGLNIGEKRLAEGSQYKGFKNAGKGAVTLRPSGKPRKHKA